MQMPGTFEWVIIFVVVLIIFGPKNLPKIGRAIGKSIHEFKNAAKNITTGDDDEEQEENEPKKNKKSSSDDRECCKKDDEETHKG